MNANISSSIADLLRVNPAITSIDLFDCRLGIEVMVSISELLKVDSSLTSLDLWMNELQMRMLWN
jgi:hypothetical protein